MWQEAIVVCIVAAAVLHAAGKYLPAAWRRRIVAALTRCGASEARMAALFKTAPSCTDGCASCGSCSSEPAPPLEAVDAKRVIKVHARPGK
ncbi:DUF6587 family protein [Janthinobacterium fluminis]|uniref:Uncharacterized protein n=1 Tax=Janthinobacterium fluminis TaxID=2987524 RepID=A0ABT5K3B6_9BURK|nr:DUF6587 family protein [Janthinobacterium fluminis]MDC8759468.1 hypothetical protein [Janthinobacterium fluminis]